MGIVIPKLLIEKYIVSNDRSKQRDFQLMSMQVQRTRGENALNVLEEYKEGQRGQGSVSEEENNK